MKIFGSLIMVVVFCVCLILWLRPGWYPSNWIGAEYLEVPAVLEDTGFVDNGIPATTEATLLYVDANTNRVDMLTVSWDGSEANSMGPFRFELEGAHVFSIAITDPTPGAVRATLYWNPNGVMKFDDFRNMEKAKVPE